MFWNSSLFYGGSTNSVDVAAWSGSFSTERWLFDTSITGIWQLDELTTLSPKLRIAYLSETVADYTIESGPAVVDMSGFTEEQLRASIGATLARDFVLGDGMVMTRSLAVTGGFAGLGGTGVFGALTAGVAVTTANDWNLDASISASVEGDGSVAASASAGAQKRF